MGRHKVGRPKPVLQWKPAAMQHGPRGRRKLIAAALALKKRPGFELLNLGVFAAWAPETVGPPTRPQIIKTRLRLRKSSAKLSERFREIWSRHIERDSPLVPESTR